LPRGDRADWQREAPDARRQRLRDAHRPGPEGVQGAGPLEGVRADLGAPGAGRWEAVFAGREGVALRPAGRVNSLAEERRTINADQALFRVAFEPQRGTKCTNRSDTKPARPGFMISLFVTFVPLCGHSLLSWSWVSAFIVRRSGAAA